MKDAHKLPRPPGNQDSSTRTSVINVLENCDDIESLDALRRMTDSEILRLPNIGPVSLRYIRDALGNSADRGGAIFLELTGGRVCVKADIFSADQIDLVVAVLNLVANFQRGGK